MKLKNIKIETLLKVGFTAMLFFVLILGAVSYQQSNKVHLQTETMYNHPLLVRRAIGEFRSNILSIHSDIKDLFLTSDENEISLALYRIEVSKNSAFKQIDALYNLYLGPKEDIDTLKKDFIFWNSIHDETISLFRAGRTNEAVYRTKSFGTGGKQADVVLDAVRKIDDFAEKKGNSLFTYSAELIKTLNIQLIILVAIIILLSLIIYFVLIRNINRPLELLTDATRRFRNGDMNARSPYESKNEFGNISAAFNSLADSIQTNAILDEKFVNLAGIMLSKNDTNEFFRETIHTLAILTGSQMAAVYLLSEDKKRFEHFASTGTDIVARNSFSADTFEGEFGTAIFTRKIQHIKNIPEDSSFIFYTVSGKFLPREIITIPISVNDEVVAIISLATIGSFDSRVIQLINDILITLSARVEGVIANQKLKTFSEKLEHQNSELEAQKTELALQSAEVMEQNAELEMQKKQLDEANRLKTNFLSNMSHELRTPLNSVIALSGVLNRRLADKIPEEEYSYLEVIERNGKHLLGLINDILDISRIESGHIEVEISKFSLTNLISEVVAILKPQTIQKNIELIQTSEGSELFIRSDESKCRHIIQNLIGNAIKFTEKGKVEVFSSLSDNSIVIKVADTGIGVPEQHIAHIFNEFRQGDSSTSRRFGGSGLGLSIAKKYANLLGGTISVKSTPGTGSEFTLSLPIYYAVENAVNETETTTGSNHSMKNLPDEAELMVLSKTILVVEDSEPAIIQIKDIMEDSGFKILIARNGSEALETIAQTIPDAIILDLMMPGIDGFEVLRTLREAEETAHVPVLILTAKHITKEELSFLKRNNIYQLIQKGDVNRQELLKTVVTMVSVRPAEKMKTKIKPLDKEGIPVILVVEDNPDNMLTVKALLEGIYKIIEAVDGFEGVEMARVHRPDLILMDIELPGMDGIDAFKIIRHDINLQHIPVIALTASAMTSERETILSHGFDGYFTKPIDEIKFLKIIRETLYGN